MYYTWYRIVQYALQSFVDCLVHSNLMVSVPSQYLLVRLPHAQFTGCSRVLPLGARSMKLAQVDSCSMTLSAFKFVPPSCLKANQICAIRLVSAAAQCELNVKLNAVPKAHLFCTKPLANASIPLY